MGLVLVLAFSLLTAVTSLRDTGDANAHNSCTESFQEHWQQSNDSAIHLTIHHVHGPCSPLSSSPLPASVILDRDQARVRVLNHRLINNQTTVSSKSTGKLRAKSVGIPLTPGTSVGVGNYVIKLGIGSPPKPYIMVFDTGSSFTWIQCEPCMVQCHPQVGALFNPKASVTYKTVSCDSLDCSSLQAATLNPSGCSRSNLCIYTASYGDGSFSLGYLSRDTLTVGSAQTLPGFLYGCGQDNEGLFGRAAGLVGLARNKFSLLAQLSSKYGYVFSYCLPTSTSTGMLSIGHTAYNPSLYTYTHMYTDSRDPALYFLRLASITVGGKALPVSTATYVRTPTIIDTGTVITRLPSAVYSALQTAFVRAMSRHTRAPPYSILDTCFKGSAAGLSVPEVRMVFEGGSGLKLGARHLLYDVTNGVTCLAFAGYSRGNGVAIIGNHQQLTFGVVYDVTNSRIGFAAGRCR
ncbi:Peptidase A1 [Cinnamomum micranthum f. kanehirae]|uniref:Peptidase A1 n=1 Tax=Cinnamomum micranthum f. kanehirae TaxID=337451 RepID=A0A443PWD3_9MAGN|nr:Peptidase A1 [Cinnamomum micranthum f. kanehirae]